MSGADDPERSDMRSALVGSVFGRAVIACILMVGTVWIVAPNMPGSTVRSRIDVVWEPAEKIGLAQDWAVFSPNPRSISIDLRALVEYDDGTIEFWDVPDLDPALGAYRAYRWNKWQERVRQDARESLWATTAGWIAGQRLRDGVQPAKVTLIRRWIDHEPLTSTGQILDAGWNEAQFYTWEREP